MTNLTALPAGTELVGDYRIDRVLGAGGFGITYLAEEIALGRKVTIKEFFPADFAARKDGIAAVPRSQGCREDYKWGLDRFIDEAQTLAKFNHANIVRVYRYFRANSTGYMVLHFEEGQSLKSWLKGLGRSPRQQELDKIIEPLLDALELIHNRDFLHRDIAPDNIIIRKDGTPVLIDFGSARGEIMANSKTVSALVKPGYSPYEQYAETTRQQGAWTDIYALGATLYHAVTGKRPADSPSRMVKDELAPARDAALAAYRSSFLHAIDHALALKVEKRPKSIKVWRKALLAPDPPKASWLTGGRGKDAGKAKAPPKPAKKPEKPAVAAKATEKLEPAAKATPAQQAAQPKKAVQFPPPTPQLRLGGFLSKLSSGGKAKQKAQDPAPKPAPAAEPAPKQAAADAAQPAKRLPRIFRSRENKGVPAVRTPKHRPRPIRKSGAFWRPLMFKFLIGVGVASAAVTLQDRLPHYEHRGSSEVSATKADVPKTIGRSATASLQKQEAAKAPQRPFWDGRPIAELRGHGGAVTAAKFSDDSKFLATASADEKIRIWNPSNQQLVRTIELDDGPALSLALSGKFAATGHENGNVVLWDWQTASKVGTFKRNDAEIWSLAFLGAPDRLAAASHDWKVTLWSTTNTSAPLQVMDAHKNAAKAIAYGRRGSTPLLVTGGADKRVKLWNLNTLDVKRTFKGHKDFITSVSLSSDGKTVASGALNGNIRIWKTNSRRTKRRLTAHNGQITDINFSPDGELLASSATDGQVRIWNASRGKTIRTLTGHTGAVNSVTFSRDGRTLATTGEDGVVRVWPNPATVRTTTAGG